MRPTHQHIISVIKESRQRGKDTSLESLIAILPYRRKDTIAEVSFLAANGYIRQDANRRFFV
jgi:hypothetical protein